MGTSLLPALSLLDSNGSVIATRDSGTGLPSSPNDPYLFTGLKAGTYYVGVSEAGNLAHALGGYDPILGIPGSSELQQRRGQYPFALGLFARPHDQPTRLLNVEVDQIDPHEMSPTGLTLTFSGPIDVSKLFLPGSSLEAIQVIDSSGQVWPMTAKSYDVNSYELKMIFNQPLSTGRYSLISSSTNGLTDLADQPVFGALNTPKVLTSWTVGLSASSRPSNDLGILWPNLANETSLDSLSPFGKTIMLVPGQGMDFRWSVIVAGFYKLQVQLQGGSLAVFNNWDGEMAVLDPGTTSRLNDYLMNLDAGSYTIRFVNEGTQPAVINWVLTIAQLDWEKILSNGLGQTSALSLSLLSAPSAVSASGSALHIISSPTGIVSGLLSVSVGSIGPVPVSLLVTTNTAPIAEPISGNQSFLVVGPVVPAGMTAMVSSGNSLNSDFRAAPVIDWSQWVTDGKVVMDLELSDQKLPQTERVVVRTNADLPAHSVPEAQSAQANHFALKQAEWLASLGIRVQQWLQRAPYHTSTSLARVVSYHRLIQDQGGGKHKDSGEEKQRKGTKCVVHADLGATACIIVVGATAC
jgi:hypothetical protein